MYYSITIPFKSVRNAYMVNTGGRVKLVFIAIAVFLVALAAAAVHADANPHVQFPHEDEIHATPQQLDELRAFYAALEQALSQKDLDGMMSFYADDYFHQETTRAQLRRLWEDTFKNYDNLRALHVINGLTVVDTEAIIVCTGSLLGVPDGSGGNGYVTINSWADQNHFISKARGSWKIVGGGTHRLLKTNTLPNGAMEHRVEQHPLY